MATGTIEVLLELLDFFDFEELDDFTELLLDFVELEDFAELLLELAGPFEDDEDDKDDEDVFSEELLDFGTLEELDDFAELLLSIAEELELSGAFSSATRLSINSSETLLFSTGYLSLSDCTQAEPSKP